jgi:hypothetical protein
MGKADKAVIIIASTILLAIATVAIISSINGNDNKRAASIKEKELASRVSALSSSRAAETQRVANEKFYQKLKEGRPVSILVIGDDIAASSGSTAGNGWIDQLTNKLYATYKSTVTVTKITQGGANIVRSWIEYNSMIDKNKQSGVSSNFDCVFICDGKDYQSIDDLKQFHMFYENLILRLIKNDPKAEIFPMIESSIKTDNGFTIDIKDIADHYGLDLIDTRTAFNQSGKNYSDLSKDGVHPNDAGYTLYAEQMYNVISGNVSKNKSVSYENKPTFFSDSPQLDNANLIKTPDTITGYQQKDNIFTSNQKGDSLTYITSGNIVYVYYNTNTNGGQFQIFVDDQYYGEINTKSTANVSTPYLISGSLTGKRTIKLVTKQGSVNIVGIVTN